MSVDKSPIVKCSYCKKIFSVEEFDTHKCEMSLVGIKTIAVMNFLDTSCNGRKVMTGWGIDGVLYVFEVVPREPIPYILPLSDESLQRKKSDKDFTESSIRIQICYKYEIYHMKEVGDGC